MSESDKAALEAVIEAHIAEARDELRATTGIALNDEPTSAEFFAEYERPFRERAEAIQKTWAETFAALFRPGRNP